MPEILMSQHNSEDRIFMSLKELFGRTDWYDNKHLFQFGKLLKQELHFE
jgi:hypothetical protein